MLWIASVSFTLVASSRSQRTHNLGPLLSRRLADSLRRGCTDSVPDFLPMHLPARPAWPCLARCPLPSRRRTRRLEVRKLAWNLAECQVAVFNYFCLDCPKSPARFLKALGRHRTSPVQIAAFEHLVTANLRFCRPGPEFPGLGRGMLRFSDLLAVFERTWSAEAGPAPNIDLSSVAMPVNPARIQIPERAGVLDPADVLPEPLRSEFLDVASRPKPLWQQGPTPKFCY